MRQRNFMKYRFVCLTLFLLVANVASLEATTPTKQELDAKESWIAQYFAKDSIPPFSFIYDGRSSNEFLNSWIRTESIETQNEKQIRTIVYRDPEGKLEVECRLVDYVQWSTFEWFLKFRNLSDAPTPIIESIQTLDASFGSEPDNGAFVPILHHAVGSPCLVSDYQPKETELAPAFTCSFEPCGGRSSNLHMPYFNVQSGRNFGWIFAIGWGGEWKTTFTQSAGLDSDSANTQIVSGQALTRFVLLPHEEVSAPSTLLLAWNRANWIDAQNLWRSWAIECSLPKINGEVDRAHLWASTDRVDAPAFNPGAKFRMETIDKYLAENIRPDYFHIDAGWYPCDDSWPKIGTWEPDLTRYPNGVAEVFKHAHEKGVGSVLWMEPERVAPNTWLTINRPEWCSDGANGGLFKYHDPDAFAWMLERIDKIVTEQEVDFYRQDFNMEPLSYWRRQDAPDRQGITEIRHVEAYYRVWQELRKRHPDIKLDACASGGRRNDYLTMRYAVPLCRSDYSGSSLGRQVQSYGAHLWIPFTGSGYGASTLEPNFQYNFRSWAFAPYSGSAIRIADDEDYEKLRYNLAIWREYVKPYFDDDYYPITPCTLSERDWIGWQYHDAKDDSGVVLVFRRLEAEQDALSPALFGLKPDAQYRIVDVDSKEERTFSGQTLMTDGLPIVSPVAPQAFVFSYRSVDK